MDLPHEQGTFVFEDYEEVAKARTQEMCTKMPAYMRFVEATNRAKGDTNKQHRLTGKSYVFQHYEGTI